MRVTTKGQVTIPLYIRERAGLYPETEVEFHYDGNIVSIVKAKPSKKAGRGARLVETLRGSAGGGLSTDEIMALTRGE